MLLEPDPSTPAYHVRKVTLNPTTGAPTWDSTVSYGTFLLPVSAAALHSSGRVVAISTDSGRFASLQPVSTPNPVQAAYSAGSGIQTGLLSSPIAIAVTNPGLVLVLDAATSQISAFDLNGNPVPYFAGYAHAALARRSPTTRRLRAGKVHAPARLERHVPRHRRRRLGPDLSPVPHRRRIRPQRLPRRRLHPYRPTPRHRQPGRQRPPPGGRLLAQHLRGQLRPARQHCHRQAADRPALGVAEPSVSRFDPSEAAATKRTKAKPKHGHKPKPKHRREPKPKHS